MHQIRLDSKVRNFASVLFPDFFRLFLPSTAPTKMWRTAPQLSRNLFELKVATQTGHKYSKDFKSTALGTLKIIECITVQYIHLRSFKIGFTFLYTNDCPPNQHKHGVVKLPFSAQVQELPVPGICSAVVHR